MIDISVVLYKPGSLEFKLIDEVPKLTRTAHVLRVFDNSSNVKNLGAAWNDLANQGAAPYVAFLHSDIVLSKDWEKPLLECLEKRPDVGVALPNPARFDQIGKTFPLSDPPTDAEMEAWASYSRENMTGAMLPFAVERDDCAVFFCAVMRRKDFRDLKGFDERFRFNGLNHEFQWRMRDKGLATVMVHASSVWHKDALSFWKAVHSGALNQDLEARHWETWKEFVRGGRVRKWHELTDVERRFMRKDRAFQIV